MHRNPRCSTAPEVCQGGHRAEGRAQSPSAGAAPPWVQGHTCRGARGDLSAGSAEFWLCLAKGVQVAGRAMSSSESGPQPCLLAPALPSKAQRLGKSGTSIYGFSAAAEEPAARERNTAFLELHLQKQLLWSFLFFSPSCEQFRCIKNKVL